jgi:hypothetical protein
LRNKAESNKKPHKEKQGGLIVPIDLPERTLAPQIAGLLI